MYYTIEPHESTNIQIGTTPPNLLYTLLECVFIHKQLKLNKMENFGKFMTVVLAMIISPIINGFVFSKLWLWFIVPTFQIQPLRVVEAIGIIFLINFIRVKRDKEAYKDKFWETFANNMIFIVLMAGFALLSGWVVTLFI